jgi:hypothetical protein
MRYYKYILFQMLICASFSAQTSIQLQAEKAEFIESYKKAWAIMSETENYSFKMRYLSFSDHKTMLVTETASGFYTKSGNNYRSYILGIKTVQNTTVKVSIDSIEKLIILSNPDKIALPVTNTDQLEELIENTKKVSKRSEKGSVVYKIDFKQNDLYESYELKLNSNGVLEQMTFFYSTIKDKDYEESIQGKEVSVSPRLEIHFDDFKVLAKTKEGEFSEKLYVLLDNKNVKKTERYKTYTIKDYRIQK